MIAFLKGVILEKYPEYVILDVQGVGYLVEIPLTTYYRLGDMGTSESLYILTLVREDSIRLFGFKSKLQKNLFEIFLAVSRVGPKLALNILSGMESEDLIQAVLKEDIRTLSRIPGLGKKTVERVIFEIKDKVQAISGSEVVQSAKSAEPGADLMIEVVSVLKNLGYKPGVAEVAAKKALESCSDKSNIQELIKLALRAVSGRKKG